MRHYSLTTLTEIALFTGLATLLDKIPLFTLPQGGSVTLAMVPILLLSFRRGEKAGLVTGCLTGCLQLVLGAYLLSPFQVLLDYLLAYAVLGLAGWGKKLSPFNLSLATVTVISLRLLCHVLAGILFYGQFAPSGTPVWLYALLYNASFILPSTLLTLLVLLLLYQTKPQFFRVR